MSEVSFPTAPCRNADCPHGRPPVQAYELYGMTFANLCEGCQRDEDDAELARVRAEELEGMMSRSGVTPMLRDWSLGTVPVGKGRELAVARSWLDGWLEGERRDLVIFGPVGTGKTGLGWGLVRELIERHRVPAVFAIWRDLLARMQRSFDRTGSRVTTDHLRAAPVVCIDDLGAEQQTDWRRDELAQLIEHRHQHRLSTIYTTNYPLDALARRLGHDDVVVGQRLVSRISENSLRLEVRGRDLRATSDGERTL